MEYVSVYQNCFIQVSIESIIPEIILNCYIACHCVVLALCEKKKSVEFWKAAVKVKGSEGSGVEYPGTYQMYNSTDWIPLIDVHEGLLLVNKIFETGYSAA